MSKKKILFGSSVSYIVQSGLLMHLDASNVNSYNPLIGGTNWNDLSFNNIDATLNENPFFYPENGGSFSFNNPSSCATSAFLPSDLIGNPQFTVSGWFKINDSIIDRGTWGFGGVSTGPNNINSYMIVTNEISISLANTCVFGTNEFYSTTQYKHICWVKRDGVFSRENIDIYVNGIKKTGESLINRFGSELITPSIYSTEGIAISKTNAIVNNSQRASTRVAEFYIYNRAIIESENSQNYNNTKSKFGY